MSNAELIDAQLSASKARPALSGACTDLPVNVTKDSECLNEHTT